LTSSQPLLAVYGLTVSKGKTKLLDNVSFTSRRGELMGVFGPSGAGKSTLLHAIAGVPDPSYEIAGQIMLNGRDVTFESAETRSLLGMAIVLQGLHLFPDMTVLENVRYPLKHRKCAPEVARTKANEILNLLRIEELAQRSVNQLSGGQQQRVALARAIIYDPCLLLLDEPFKGLEQELREQLLADICMQVRRDIGVLLVTHEKRELRLAADSLIEIREGRLVRSEERRHDKDHGGFETTADAVLLPSTSGDAAFVRAHVIGISTNGNALVRHSEGVRMIKAQVLDRRRSEPLRSALLLRYESGQAGWVEVSSADATEACPGEWISIEYTLSSTQEKRHV
jgi:ABC-type sulfate/molybdate transport systems ATPase subunit